MDFAVFCALAYRLPAYQGAMAAVAAQQRQGSGGGAGGRAKSASGQRYEQAPQRAVTPRTADEAPPATAASLAALNAQLGAVWFAHRTVTAAEVAAAGGQPDTRPGLQGGDA